MDYVQLFSCESWLQTSQFCWSVYTVGKRQQTDKGNLEGMWKAPFASL